MDSREMGDWLQTGCKGETVNVEMMQYRVML